ncbi:MAG TPA: hypothetical protein VG839_04090 [Asticcacaulis sp.]|nr:hypothetical protein [Asticcacaulis sp.]
MAREYGRKLIRPVFNLRVELRYVIAVLTVGLAFLIPRVLHHRPTVVLGEAILWLGFIAWWVFSPRQR